MTPFEHQVRERAYYIWEDEGRVFGRADDHWLRAEAELSAGAHPALVVVQAVSPALTLAASPAEMLGETLKAKPGRARAETVAAKARTTAKAAAEPAPKPAKATKAAASKPAPAKAAKPAASKSTANKASKVAARPRTAEAVATVH